MVFKTTGFLSKLMLLGIAPVLLMDSVGFFGWTTVAPPAMVGSTLIGASPPEGDETEVGVAAVSSVSQSSFLTPALGSAAPAPPL